MIPHSREWDRLINALDRSELSGEEIDLITSAVEGLTVKSLRLRTLGSLYILAEYVRDKLHDRT